jgi:transcriptional regulator with XRE-family HTH domain
MLDRIGRRVAELRAERGWTQAAFAERMGIATKYLQRIEAGDENLTVSSLLRLAEALAVELEELFVPPTTLRRPGRPQKKR